MTGTSTAGQDRKTKDKAAGKAAGKTTRAKTGKAADKGRAKAGKTLVTLLLDRSGSMESVRDDTIGAVNAYVGGLAQSEEDIRFSLVLFDAVNGAPALLDKVVEAKEPADIAPLTREVYVPRGMTPLIDAACITIHAIEASLAARSKSDPIKVVVAIQTDGQENSSREHGWADLRRLISKKEGEGWEFLFMGCGIDAYAPAREMGLSAAKTVSYGRSKAEIEAVFSATAVNTVDFAAGTRSCMDYSAGQKLASGDLTG